MLHNALKKKISHKKHDNQNEIRLFNSSNKLLKENSSAFHIWEEITFNLEFSTQQIQVKCESTIDIFSQIWKVKKFTLHAHFLWKLLKDMLHENKGVYSGKGIMGSRHESSHWERDYADASERKS